MLVEVTTFLACTVTAYAALASGLLSLVAVIVAVPGATAVILPSESTVAIASSLEVQVTEALVAVSGVTVAVTVTVLPTVRTPSVLSRVIPSTFVVTVTLVSAFRSSGTTPNAESIAARSSGIVATLSSVSSESAASTTTTLSSEASASLAFAVT